MASAILAPIVVLMAFLSSLVALLVLFLVFPREITRIYRAVKNRLNSFVPLPGEHRPWFWKGVGGSIGYLIGGPLGLIAGVVFGHSIARESSEVEVADLFSLASTETMQGLDLDQAQAVFFLTTFAMLAKLTVSDATVQEEELAAVRAFIDQRLELDADRRKLAIDIFVAAKESDSDFNAYAVQFYSLFQDHPEVLEEMVDILLTAATSDGRFHLNEALLLNSAGEIFKLDQERLVRVQELRKEGEKDPHVILGSSAADGEGALHQKYRELVRSYHPDRIIGEGVASEFLPIVDERFSRLEEAFSDALSKVSDRSFT